MADPSANDAVDLSPIDRQLAIGIAAVCRGNWQLLGDALTRLRDLDAARAEAEEMLLQAVLFAGFPRAISGFAELAAIWPTATSPAGGNLPLADQPAAGRALFAAIYGHNDERVRQMLLEQHGELHDFVLDAAYGRILSRPALEPRRRELLAVAALAALAQPRQFVAHARGALRFGSNCTELRSVVGSVFGGVIGGVAGGADAAEWLRLLDRLPLPSTESSASKGKKNE